MALAGFLSSFAKPLWTMVSPLVKQAGRGIASMLVSNGAQKLTQVMADKGITMNPNSIQNINSNLKRARNVRQAQRQEQQQVNQEPQQWQQQQIVVKTKPIQKAPKRIPPRGNSRYLRKR